MKNKLPTFSCIFHNLQVEWKEIYLLPHKDSIDTNLRIFQYKLLNNILYLNKQIIIFNEKNTKLYSYCRLQNETTNPIFVECKFAIKLWSNLRHYCRRSLDLSLLNSHSANLNWNWSDLLILLKDILLSYKYYICLSRDSSKLSFASLLKHIKDVFDLEKNIDSKSEKLKLSLKNWARWCN